MTRVLAREYTVQLYRQNGWNADPDSGSRIPKWEATGETEEWIIQPMTAGLRPTDPGEVIAGGYVGFAPCDSCVAEDDRLLVTTRLRDPGVLKVTGVGDPGATDGTWDLEVELVKTDERIQPNGG